MLGSLHVVISIISEGVMDCILSPPISYVKALIHSVAVFGTRALREVIQFTEAMWMGLVSLKAEERHQRPLFPHRHKAEAM